jgi:hypothetical protein
MTTSVSRLMIAGALASASVGCQHGPALRRASGAAQARGIKDAVQAVQNSVRVIAQVREWPRPAEITNVVTPGRITIPR